MGVQTSIRPFAAAPSRDELIKRAEAIAQQARNRVEETERSAAVLPELIHEMKASGLSRIMQPRRWAGYELSWPDLFDVTYTISQACPTTGWVYNVLAAHPPLVATFDEQAQADLWGDDPDTLISSALKPTGRAAAVDGGYVLCGQFPYSSGSDYAQWALLGAIGPGDDDAPGMLLLLVPMAELRRFDDWNAIGLRATGSKSLVAKDVFVPAHRVIRPAAGRGSVTTFVVQAALVGMVMGGVKAFIDNVRAKPAKVSELTQVETAKAWAEINGAWDLLRGSVAEAEAVAPMGMPMPLDLAIKTRATNGLITALAVSAIDRVHALSGTQGVLNSPVARAFRDAHVAAQHIHCDRHVSARDAGAWLLADA